MEHPDLSGPMLARTRNHMLVAVLGVVTGVAFIALGRVLGGAIFGVATPGWWMALSFLVGAAMIPTIGISSAFHFLRCPSCNGLVVFQVNAQASPFAARYGKQCRHCNTTIFDGRLTRRMRIAQVSVFVSTILLFGGLSLFR